VLRVEKIEYPRPHLGDVESELFDQNCLHRRSLKKKAWAMAKTQQISLEVTETSSLLCLRAA